MSVLIQDGQAIGHRSWLEEALDAGLADGGIVSPFTTPEEDVPRHPSAATLVEVIHAHSGEAIFDATTHAVTLPGVSAWRHYDTWRLWEGDRGDLSDSGLLGSHLARVFAHQEALGVPHLTPTVHLESAASNPNMRAALELARQGRRRYLDAWQSVAGASTFWASGARLDAYVGQLAQFRAPCWLTTFVRSDDTYPPDPSDTRAEAGLLRTVRALSVRSRVIVAHGDFFGLPAMAAGADALGTGWHGGQRMFSGASYRDRSGGTNVRHVTHPVLLARLKPDAAEALERENPALARRLRGGVDLPRDDGEARRGHLAAVRDHATAVRDAGGPRDRVELLRDVYDQAVAGWTRVLALIPTFVSQTDLDQWVTHPRAALEAYAISEGY